MIPVEDVQALRAEAKALRAEVREVVAILENWNSIEPGRGREVRLGEQIVCPPNSRPAADTRAGGCEPLPAASAPMMVRPEGQE